MASRPFCSTPKTPVSNRHSPCHTHFNRQWTPGAIKVLILRITEVETYGLLNWGVDDPGVGGRVPTSPPGHHGRDEVRGRDPGLLQIKTEGSRVVFPTVSPPYFGFKYLTYLLTYLLTRSQTYPFYKVGDDVHESPPFETFPHSLPRRRRTRSYVDTCTTRHTRTRASFGVCTSRYHRRRFLERTQVQVRDTCVSKTTEERLLSPTRQYPGFTEGTTVGEDRGGVITTEVLKIYPRKKSPLSVRFPEWNLDISFT